MSGLIIVRGAGDIATGTIAKLAHCGFRVLALERVCPTAIRRSVALCEAVYAGTTQVEDLLARRIETEAEMEACHADGEIPLAIDPEGEWIRCLSPQVVVDAMLAKKNLGTHKAMAPITIALGPGFCAGRDVHAVIETMRGHALGRVLYAGEAMANTGVPGTIAGENVRRVIHAPCAGTMHPACDIGDRVQPGQVIAYLDNTAVQTQIGGVLRGLLREGFSVTAGMKMADVDPREGERENCYTISDKARCIAGGVLEAVLHLQTQKEKLT